MNPLLQSAHRLRALFGKGKLERNMTDEMRFHLDQRAADYAADGLSPEEASFAAQRKFGNVASIQEQARAGRGWMWLDNFAQDLLLGVRSLFKSPGFTFIAVITLGLGIGANTAMFSVLNSSIVRPLPYPGLEQLEQIYRTTAQRPQGQVSAADFLDLQRARAGYGDFAAYQFSSSSLAEPGQPAHQHFGARASVNLFVVLGVQPQLGRNFRTDEDVSGNGRVVILSQRLWRIRFANRPDIVGQTIRLDGEPHQVIGVLSESFNEWRHLGGVDMFRPLALNAEQAVDRQATTLRVIGRRDAGRTAAEGAEFVTGFGARLAREFSSIHAETIWHTVPLQSTVADADFRLMLPMLVGLSAFVLLLACSNLANLMLARTMMRTREFAVRAALGASRLHLLRPLIVESLLLSLAGGVMAVFVALWVHDWIAGKTTNEYGEHITFALDWRVLPRRNPQTPRLSHQPSL